MGPPCQPQSPSWPITISQTCQILLLQYNFNQVFNIRLDVPCAYVKDDFAAGERVYFYMLRRDWHMFLWSLSDVSATPNNNCFVPWLANEPHEKIITSGNYCAMVTFKRVCDEMLSYFCCSMEFNLFYFHNIQKNHAWAHCMIIMPLFQFG